MLDIVLSLIPITLIGIVLWLLLRPTFLRSRLSRIRERRIYQRARDAEGPSAPSRLPFVYVAAAWMAVLVIGIAFAPSQPAVTEAIGNTQQTWSAYRSLVTAAAFVVALIIHLRPNHSRALKYGIVFAAIPSLDLFVSGGTLRDVIAGYRDLLDALVTGVLIVLAFWWIAAFLAIGASLPRWCKAARTISETGRATSALYLFAFFRSSGFGPGVLLCLFFVHDIGLLLLAGRYVLVEAFRLHPIVYLRSFRHDGAAITFGRAVAPALAPLGVIRALVHGKQTGSTLLSRTSIWQFGLLATVADEHWQSWVGEALAQATLAVVDCTMPSKSVDWEIRTSLEKLGPRRVLVTSAQRDAASPLGFGEVLFYTNDPAGRRALKRQVREWAAGVLGFDLRKALRIRIFAWSFIGVFALARLVLVTLLLTFAQA
jgi:hypothetical protein